MILLSGDHVTRLLGSMDSTLREGRSANSDIGDAEDYTLAQCDMLLMRQVKWV